MKEAIAGFFDVGIGQVVAYRVYGDQLATLIDYGIKGTKKFTFNAVELEANDTPPDNTPPIDYGAMLKKELVVLAEDAGIDGYESMKKAELVEALENLA